MTPEELQRHLEMARPALEPRWDEARARRVEARLPARERQLRRRAQLTRAVAVLVVALVAVGLARARRSDLEVEPLNDAVVSELAVPSERSFQVSRGAVRFSAKRTSARTIRVLAGETEIVVVGARFLAERIDERVRVLVEEGDVVVRCQGTEYKLRAGDERTFPPVTPAAFVPLQEDSIFADEDEGSPVEVVADEASTQASSANRVAPGVGKKRRVQKKPAPESSSSPEWMRLARQQEFARAWEVLQGAPRPRDEPAELLLAADVARFSGHASSAVQHLQQLIRNHKEDSRAPLAAFTLGRIFLDDLGQPREALQAFATARLLAPKSPLAEDSLARQVEAASKSHDPSARTLAEQFLTLYPTSTRVRSVRYFGGLQP